MSGISNANKETYVFILQYYLISKMGIGNVRSDKVISSIF